VLVGNVLGRDTETELIWVFVGKFVNPDMAGVELVDDSKFDVPGTEAGSEVMEISRFVVGAKLGMLVPEMEPRLVLGRFDAPGMETGTELRDELLLRVLADCAIPVETDEVPVEEVNLVLTVVVNLRLDVRPTDVRILVLVRTVAGTTRSIVVRPSGPMNVRIVGTDPLVIVVKTGVAKDVTDVKEVVKRMLLVLLRAEPDKLDGTAKEVVALAVPVETGVMPLSGGNTELGFMLETLKGFDGIRVTLLKEGVETLILVFSEVGTNVDEPRDGNDVTRLELEVEESVRLFEEDGEVDSRALLVVKELGVIDDTPVRRDFVLMIPVEIDTEVCVKTLELKLGKRVLSDVPDNAEVGRTERADGSDVRLLATELDEVRMVELAWLVDNLTPEVLTDIPDNNEVETIGRPEILGRDVITLVLVLTAVVAVKSVWLVDNFRPEVLSETPENNEVGTTREEVALPSDVAPLDLVLTVIGIVKAV